MKAIHFISVTSHKPSLRLHMLISISNKLYSIIFARNKNLSLKAVSLEMKHQT